jgi:hypothetical protein
MTFVFGSILHPIATISRFHLGSMNAFYFPILPIWPNCNNFMDPLGVLRWWFFPFCLVPFSISPTCNNFDGHLWKEKKNKKSITDQIRLFYDEIRTPLAMRTVLTCSHEDQTTVFAFTAAMTTYSYQYCTPTGNYATVVVDCRLDQCPGGFSFSNFLMLNQKWRSATRGFSQIWLQDK